MTKVTIYTDGACKGNPGIGGWGALLISQQHQKEIYGHAPQTTNNRMELTAAIKALQALKHRCEVELFTDSVYLKNGITLWIHNWQKNGWKNSKKQAVKNADLWQSLLQETAKHSINWHWVKGHSGDSGNERADELANKGIEQACDK